MAPMERLRERWPHTLVLDFQPDGAAADASAELVRAREAADPVEICAAFMEWVDATLPDHAQQCELRSVVEAVRHLESA